MKHYGMCSYGMNYMTCKLMSAGAMSSATFHS